MGILDAGFALFEYTNQRIWDLYDVVLSSPAVVKMFQQNHKKVHRRKEKGLIGNLKRTASSSNSIKKDKSVKFRIRGEEPTSMNSPPTTKVSTIQQTTPRTPAEAPEKIRKLESELSKLRDEINKLMSNSSAPSQPPPPSLPMSTPQTSGGAAGTVSFPSQPVVPPSFVPNNNPVVSYIAGSNPSSSSNPPPAPPPLPGATTSTVSTTYVRAPKPPTERMLTKRHVQQKGSLSLADALKGASSLNLRKTEVSRSPGGTPREASSKKVNSSDPQDLIAAALKKKFEHLQRLSTDTPDRRDSGSWDDFDDNEEDSSFSSSPEPAKGKYKPIYFNDENTAPVENVDPAY